MKNLILLVIIAVCGTTVMAQGTGEGQQQATPPKTTQAAEKKEMPVNEYVRMTEGKLWHHVGTAKTELTGDKQVKLGETIVKADGTVTMKDGTSAKMKEGNIVNMQGKLIDVAQLRQKAAEQKAMQKPVEQKAPESQPKSE